MDWRVPLYSLTIDEEEIKAVSDVMRDRWITMGHQTEQFEAEFSQRLGLPLPSVAMNSCTAALHTAMHVLGIGPGDEVLVPSMTFVASAACIKMAGAKPVFVDSQSFHDFNMDPLDLEKKITSNTKGIVVVHYGGYSANMPIILEIARKHDLKVIEDVAHGPLVHTSLGMLGTLGDIGCFSFFSTKNMTTGEGGMLVSRDADLLAKAKLHRSHYMGTSSWSKHHGRSVSYNVTGVGMNYRMTDIGAAMGRIQLQKYDANQQAREQLVQRFRYRLRSLPQLILPYADIPEAASSHHIFPVLLPMDANRLSGLNA